MPTRCQWITAVIGIAVGFCSVDAWTAELATVDGSSVGDYVRSCRKPNGAFGPFHQEYTDLAWNYPAVHTLKLLGEPIDEPEKILAEGFGTPAGQLGLGYWRYFQWHGLRALLTVAPPIAWDHPRVAVKHSGWSTWYYGSPFGIKLKDFYHVPSGATPDPLDLHAAELGYINLSSLHFVLEGLHASGRAPDNAPELAEFIRRMQAPGGGFADVRTADGQPDDADAHAGATFHAVAALTLLGMPTPNAARCVAFLQQCQLPSGGFLWNPNRELPGNQADIYYTWAAVTSLAHLQARPRGADREVAWINTLQNPDGGFGDQPGWRSRLYSTYYAIDALKLLTGDAKKSVTRKSLSAPKTEPIAAGKFQIYQGLFKVPVLQKEEVPSLKDDRFNLVALKSEKFADAESVLGVIGEQHLPMDAILCPEAYPHRLKQWGEFVLDHVGNFTLDARWKESQRGVWDAANAAGKKSLPWEEYRQQVLLPLRRLGALVYPEQDFELEYAYRSYGSSLADETGYNTVLTGFNWAPRDFVRVFPWRERYVDKLTTISDCDAHGTLAAWRPHLQSTRHLYLARAPSYADFQDAVAGRRVVSVIVNPVGVPSGVTYYGPPAVVEYVKQRIDEWRWWRP